MHDLHLPSHCRNKNRTVQTKYKHLATILTCYKLKGFKCNPVIKCVFIKWSAWTLHLRKRKKRTTRSFFFFFWSETWKKLQSKEDGYRVWWCSLFAVFMGGGGSSCVMTPLILTSDVLLTQALSSESVRLLLNKLWPRFLLLLPLLFLCLSFSSFLVYHVTLFLFWHLHPWYWFIFRVSNYEIFWYTHNLFIVFYIILMVHMVG